MSDAGRPALTPDFYARDTAVVARALLGAELVTTVDGTTVSGRIVEVEAYTGPDDPAAHGYGNRKTERNSAMFGPPGTAYVYFIYGMHWCFNAVTEAYGIPAAVLVRALEPLSGLDEMAQRRGTEDRRIFCSGPARLCQALGIDRRFDGQSLVDGSVRIVEGRGLTALTIGSGPRIGISRAKDWPFRFFVRGSKWLSRRDG